MKDVSAFKEEIGKSFASIQHKIPVVEYEALQLIKNNCIDIRQIEYYLDTLHSLHISGFEIIAHNPLVAYLKTLSPELAQWHKEEFEKEN